MKKITVSARDLFRDEAVGGLTYEEWTAADDLARLRSRLSHIADRAQALAETPYTSESDFPGNMLSRAQALAQTARNGLKAVEAGEVMAAAWYAIDTGKQMGELNQLLTAWDRVQVIVKQREANSKGGKAPKRKQWAEDLAEHLAGLGVSFPKAWETIPEEEEDPGQLLRLDEDTGVHLSHNGNKVFALDLVSGNELGEMSRSNFEKRYFRPAKQNPDSN